MTATATEKACPKCGGRMWDNRADKKNPKAPDFKCRDKSCDGVIWPPRGRQASPAPQTAPVTDTPEWLDEHERHEAEAGKALTHGAMVAEKLNGLMASYDLCFSHAVGIASKAEKVGTVVTLEGLSSIAATLFIAAREKGLV